MTDPIENTTQKLEKRYSIKRYLTTALLIAVTVSTAVSSAWVYHDAAREVEELFDASLAQSARVLHGMVTRENIKENKQHLLNSLDNKDQDFEKYAFTATPHGHKYEKKISFQVWGSDKELLLKSSNITSEPMSKLVRGFGSKQLSDSHWRTFTLFSKHDDYWMIIAERDDIRAELTHDIARDHMLPVILCLPILGLLVWLTISNGLTPLRKIATQVGTQQYERLSQIEESKTPQEVESLLSAINQLFSRLNQSYQREQRFVSNAAHELRNPLASVLIHTGNIIEDVNSGTDQLELNQQLKHISNSTQRLSRLVSQLLTLSRSESDQFTVDDTNVDLALLVSEVSQDFPVQLREHRLDCDLVVGRFVIKGNLSLLEACLRNLIDNAFRYGEDTTTVVIQGEINDGLVSLLVEDDGPGIAEKERDKVLSRFYRSNTQNTEGSGLGLAIVKQVVEQHKATLKLSESVKGGLIVMIRFNNANNDNSLS